MITLILMLMCLHRTVLYLCTVLCFALSLFLYACTYACVLLVCLFYMHPACVFSMLTPVHSHSCICLLRGVAYSLGVIAYILL